MTRESRSGARRCASRSGRRSRHLRSPLRYLGTCVSVRDGERPADQSCNLRQPPADPAEADLDDLADINGGGAVREALRKPSPGSGRQTFPVVVGQQRPKSEIAKGGIETLLRSAAGSGGFEICFATPFTRPATRRPIWLFPVGRKLTIFSPSSHQGNQSRPRHVQHLRVPAIDQFGERQHFLQPLGCNRN